jgi:hypothetical protein
MFSIFLVAVSTAGEPVEPGQVVMSPEAAAEEAHEELMGELQAMAADVRSIDIELLKQAMQAHQEEQAALVSLETTEITDDSGNLLLAPVPVMGPSVTE